MASIQTHRELRSVLQERLIALLNRDETELRARGLLVQRDLTVINLRRQLDDQDFIIAELSRANIVANDKENTLD